MNRNNMSQKPITMWGYFWLQILFAIPFVGLVSLICFAFFSNNINRRNFARSYFCVAIIILIIIGASLLLGGGAAIVDALKGLAVLPAAVV